MRRCVRLVRDTHKYTHTRIHAHTRTHMCTHIQMHAHTRTHAQTHARTNTRHTHTHTHPHPHPPTHTHTTRVHILTHISCSSSSSKRRQTTTTNSLQNSNVQQTTTRTKPHDVQRKAYRCIGGGQQPEVKSPMIGRDVLIQHVVLQDQHGLRQPRGLQQWVMVI